MQFFDANGNPLVGGKLFTYAAGTTTPQATFTDYGGGTANTNPVIFNSRGEAAVWCGNDRYYMVLKDADDVELWTADNVNGPNGPTLALLAAGNGATLVGYTAPDNGAVSTVNARLNLLDGVSVTATSTDQEFNAAINAYRNASAVTGGTAGFVNPNIYARTVSGSAETAYEWTVVSIMDNYSAAGENVAVYAQGNKRSTGPTWAAVAEAKDFTNTANPAAGLIGIEVDVFANGTDANSRRIGIDLVAGKGVAGGATSQTYAGIRIVPFAVDDTNATFINGILLQGQYTTGLNISATGTWGIYMSGIKTVGIDLSGGTHNDAAIRIKEKEAIQFNAAGTSELFYDSTISTPGLFYSFSNVYRAGFLNNGDVLVNSTVRWPGASTSTTVGAAGLAAALPANPSGYVRIVIDGVNFKFPYYAS
jgi:hypothetical protein